MGCPEIKHCFEHPSILEAYRTGPITLTFTQIPAVTGNQVCDLDEGAFVPHLHHVGRLLSIYY